jgi:hypothetical protein
MTAFIVIVAILAVLYFCNSVLCHLESLVWHAERIDDSVNEIEDMFRDFMNEVEEDDFATDVVFYAIVNGKKIRIEDMILKANEKFKATVAFKDKFGNDAKVDGIPSFSGDDNLATITPSEDGLSVEVLPKGPVGSFLLQCSADADMGEGVKAIIGELPVEIVAGDAERVELTAGPAEQA